MKLEKDRTRSTQKGAIFEQHLAGIIALRLRALRRRDPSLHFLVATNVQGANPFDDIVVHLSWQDGGRKRAVTYFLQLKHKDNTETPVRMNDLTGKVSTRNKDFNLGHYFHKFQEAEKKLHGTPEEKMTATQRGLCEWLNGDFRLVLFTTKEVHHYGKDAKCRTAVDFPLEELLATGKGTSFRFGEADTEVWDMLNGAEAELLFRLRFLERLRVFSGQAPARELQPLLAEAIREALAGLPPRSEALLARHTAFLHDWWEGDDGECLTEETDELECTVRKDIHDQLRCFRFTPAKCAEFSERIARCNVSYIVVSDVPSEYRCSIANTCMEESHPGRYVILTDTAFKDYNCDILHSICYKLCDEVIFNIDEVSESIFDFIQKLLSYGRFKIRILSSELKVDVYNYLTKNVGCYHWSETWSLDQLINEEQKAFLENKVCFQGRWIQLIALVEAWPSLLTCIGGSALAALASGRPVALGAPLPLVDPFYLPRTVLHHTTLSESIFDLLSAYDNFALIGFPEFILSNLRGEDSLWEEKSWEEMIDTEGFGTKFFDDAQMSEGNTQRTKWCVWKSGEIPAIDLVDKRVHWLSYETDQIVWQYSVGDTSSLENFVNKLFVNCHCTYLCLHEDPCDFLVSRAMLLSDSAGMGKSTFINFMANAFKDARKTDWVIIVNLNDKFIEQLPQKKGIDDIINFLVQYVQQNTNNHLIPVYPFLRCCFLDTNNLGRFKILLDGVDELSSTHQIIALEFIKLIKSNLYFDDSLLLVATRTMLEEDLAQVLRCPTPLSLRPFSRNDQLRFFKMRCRKLVERGKTNSSEDLSNTIVQATAGLCEVPLYAGMLADALTNDDLPFFLGDTSPLSFLSRVALYRRFLQKTIYLFWEKVGLPTRSHEYISDKINEEFEDHKMLAALVVFRDKCQPRDVYDSFKTAEEKLSYDKSKEQLLRIGIVTRIVECRPQFQHHSFAEYLAAAWLRDRYMDKRGLAEVLYTDCGPWEHVRYFFDALLAESGSTLHGAALAGHLDPNDPSLSKHMDVNQEDNGARRPLHIAAIYGHVKVVRLLLNRKAIVTPRDKVLGWTPLQYIDAIVTSLLERHNYACQQNEKKILQYLMCAEELLLECENPKIYRKLFREQFLLDIALKNDLVLFAKTFTSHSKRKIFKWIIKNNVKQDERNMFLAIEYGSINVIRLFLGTFGYQKNIKEKYSNKSLLHIAADRGHGNVCALLIERGAEVNARDENNCTPLHLAARSFAWVCGILLDKEADIHAKNQDGRSPLHFGAWWGQDGVCSLLIKHEAIVNSTDNKKQSPLHLAAMKGHVSTCRVLLDNNGTIEARDVDGMTPLLIAASKGHLPMCRFLVDIDAVDIDAVDDEGRCALFHAAGRSSEEVCKMLLERGSKFQADSHKNTPLHEAAVCNNVNICQLFLDQGFSVNARNEKGRTALHLAASEQVTLALLAKNADLNVVDLSKYTALHYAAEKGKVNICRVLIEGGIDIDAKTTFGYTALHLASRQEREEICKLLLESDADVNATDKGGNTALHTLLMKEREQRRISFKEELSSVKYYPVKRCFGRNKVHRGPYSQQPANSFENIQNQSIHVGYSNEVNIGYHNFVYQMRIMKEITPDTSRIARLCHLFVDKGANVHHLNLKGEKPSDIALRNSLVDVCEILNNSMLNGI